jgi:hypothetical protein
MLISWGLNAPVSTSNGGSGIMLSPSTAPTLAFGCNVDPADVIFILKTLVVPPWCSLY